MSSTEIKLVSGDGVHFTVPRNVAEKSGLIRTTVGFGADTGGGNSSGADGSDGSGTSSTAEQELPIPNVNAAILKSILKYLEYHLENPTVPIEKPLRDDIYHLGLPQWDIDFIEKDRSQQEIYDLIAGAMYLDIPSLVDLGCAKVASLIKGKNPKEIRQTFGVKRDFTPAERKALYEQYSFLKEADELSQNLSDEDIHRLLNEQLEQAAPVNGGAAANTEEGQSAPSS